MQDIDELIEMFKAADDRNYTLFTYVNELNQEVAKLEEQVLAMVSLLFCSVACCLGLEHVP
jgi:coiled-coil domain-containing protein 63/114